MKTHPGATAVWVAFAYLFIGVNLLNPLVAHVRSSLALSTGTIAALYSAYLIALVPLLLILPRLRIRSSARSRLIGAVLLMVFAGLLHAASSLWPLTLGRFVMAMSVAVGTAAVAELAVQLAGERGRTTTATANTAGALIGTLLGGAALALTKQPLAIAYVGHALAGAALILWLRRVVPARDRGPVTRESAVVRPGGSGRRDGLLLGGFAFAMAGAVIVLGPTLFETRGGELDAAAALVPLALFTCAAFAQRVVPPSRASITSSAILAIAGVVLMLQSTLSGSFPLLVLSAAVTGAGFGAVFKLGLTWTTQGADYVLQGRLASAYACIAYAYAAAVIIGGGYLADAAGPGIALSTVLASGVLSISAWSFVAFRGPDPLGRRDPTAAL